MASSSRAQRSSHRECPQPICSVVHSPLFQPFLLTTLRISKSLIPLIHEVIPLMDALTHTLDDKIKDRSAHITIRAAAARGRALIDKYYSKTDESIMYRLGMSELYFRLIHAISDLHLQFSILSTRLHTSKPRHGRMTKASREI